MTLLELAWLAGIVEGEGCFCFDKRCIKIAVAMTDQDVMERVGRLFGVPVTARGPYPPGKKRVYGIQLYSNRAAGWMMTLYPFLGLRRSAKVRELLAIWKTQRSFRSHKLKTSHTSSSDTRENRAA